MKPSSLVGAAAISISALVVPATVHAEQKLVPAQSEIVFVSKQMGVPVEGRFKRFDAQVAFDPEKPAFGRIAFTVDIASATLGLPETDAELPKATWFNAAKFSQATFQSTSIKGLGTHRFEISGKLNVKGTSRDVVIPVTLVQAGATTSATGSFAIKWLTFKIGENE